MPNDIYRRTRPLYCKANAVTYLQLMLASIIPEMLRTNVLFWLNNILAHHKDVEELIEVIGSLELLIQQNIYLHQAKCHL